MKTEEGKNHVHDEKPNNEMQKKKQHIAVLAFPFGTHAAPLLSLAWMLSSAAHNVTFSFFNTAKSNASIFSSSKEEGRIKVYDVSDGMPENYVFSGNPQEPVELFLKATPNNFMECMKLAVADVGSEFTCIITDAFLWFATDMARTMQIPWIALWTAGPRALLFHLETDFIRQNIDFEGGLEDRSVDIIPGCSKIRGIDIPQGIISGDIQAPFPKMLHKMSLSLPQATAVAINSFDALDDIIVNHLKSKIHQFLNIGPFALTCPHGSISDPFGCLSWLETQKRKSVVYISFGSIITPPPQELTALAEAIGEGDFPFLWSMKGNLEENLPTGFLEKTKDRGKIVEWSPQLKVLQHNAIGVFVTHGGWNSVCESIIGVVPMICRPFLGDQTLNARTIEAIWEIGIQINGRKMTKNEILKALTLILLTDEGNKMRSKLESIHQHAMNAVTPQGTSIRNFETLVQLVMK